MKILSSDRTSGLRFVLFNTTGLTVLQEGISTTTNGTMERTKRYKKGVEGVVVRARRYAPVIGEYVEHFISPEHQLVVRLSNGQVVMPEEAAHCQHEVPSLLRESWIEEIAASFIALPVIEKKVIKPTAVITFSNLVNRVLSYFRYVPLRSAEVKY